MITILHTEPGDEHFHLFENFPKEIYNQDQLHVKHSEGINIQFLQTSVIVLFNNKVCARASLYNNPNLRYQDNKTISIGNYESANIESVAGTLFLALISESKKSGLSF